MDNLLKQSTLLYSHEFQNLYNTISNLIKIFEETFQNKNDEYINLLFFIFRQQYRNIYVEDIRIKLLENFFANNLLLKKSIIFLSETLKELKPSILNENKKKKENEGLLVSNFMNLKDKKLLKYQNIINICNNIKSIEFNELLLYFFEAQCQSYFLSILKKNNNNYSENCCEELLLKLSLNYLKKAIQYLYEHKNENNNNLLKFYAIAFIKTYLYFYVEINYKYYDKCNFGELNIILDDKNENNSNNELIRKMRNIYIWRLYCKKFENFEQFKNFEFEKKNIPIYKELLDELEKEKDDNKYIFKESFISPKNFENYKKMALEFEQKDIKFNNEEINKNFDLFYSCLVNTTISHLYEKDNINYINKLKHIYEITYKNLNFGEEGKILYKYLLNNDLFKNNIEQKISDENLSQEDFEILLYSFRLILNSQISNKKCFYNDILKKNTNLFIKNNYIPGSFPLINEFIKSYNILEIKLQLKLNMGYYICKDCGYLYEVQPCTFPIAKNKCPKGHVIGGIDHLCSKKDIRVFYEKSDDEQFSNEWKAHPQWLNSFEHSTLKDFKKYYVDKNILEQKKGIINDYSINEFKKNYQIIKLKIITFRILNFILYSYLIGSFILNNLNKDEMKNYLVENLFPHTLFGIIKKNWELLGISLSKIGI